MTLPNFNTALTLGATIAAQAQAQGDRLACTFLHADQPPQQITYRQLHYHALHYAAYLRTHKIEPGALVLLAGQHELALVVAFVGALYAGAVPAIFPYMARYSKAEIYLRRLTERATAYPLGAVLITADLQATLATHLAGTTCLVLALEPFDTDLAATLEQGDQPTATAFPLDNRPITAPGYLQFGSGTTGEAKGAVLSHGATLQYIAAMAQSIALHQDDVLVGWLPFHHDLGLVGYLFLPLLTGLHVVTMAPDLWVRRPHVLLRAIHDYRGTLAMLPTFALAHTLRVVREEELVGLDLHTLRWLLVGAEMIQPHLVQAFQSRFLPYGLAEGVIYPAYGMAECVLAVTLRRLEQDILIDPISRRRLVDEQSAQPLAASDPDAIAIAGCGLPLPNVTLTIVDDAGRPLPDRHVGEIVVRCPFLFDGYLQRPDLTTSTLRDGHFYTGDLGYCAGGQLFVVGRKQDLIIAAGKNIYPESIERLAIAELGERAGRAAAFGVRDERLGTELPVLVCEVRGRIADEQQQQYRQQLRWLVQQELDIVLADVQLVRRGWLAITTSGKVARAATRAKYLAEGFQPQATAQLPPDLRQQSPAEIELALGVFFGDALGSAPVDATADLMKMGVNSLRLVQLLNQLQESYGCSIGIEQFVRQPTITHLAQLLGAALPTTPQDTRVPDLPLLRQPYHKNPLLNHLINDGMPYQQHVLPYTLGLRLQRAWLRQPWIQNRFFRRPLTRVKYMASQIGERHPQEAILRSLMCNIWSYWRIHHLAQPATFARWCTVHSPHTEWPPKSTTARGGVIYALSHTPDSYSFIQALEQHGMTPTVIAWGETAELTAHQVRTIQVYQAQQTLRNGGNVVIFADALNGSGGITVDFWGSRRTFRPGMATLAETTGATVLPVFSSFATTGEVTFELAAPLIAQGKSPEQRIESLLVQYVELLRSRWAQLYSNLWWRFVC
ncbi:MAG: AMP-binding protein [Caldilineaceae bacterium]|nr:AMP-binding protein [Caldilineaceae bacterium]